MAGCSCGSCGCDKPVQPKLIYACSGAANTGNLADGTARKLMNAGLGKMTCLAAMGAELSGFIESAKASINIVIDGCPVSCGKKIFDKFGIPHLHYKTTDYGVEKGKTEITEDIIRSVTAKIAGDVAHACV